MRCLLIRKRSLASMCPFSLLSPIFWILAPVFTYPSLQNTARTPFSLSDSFTSFPPLSVGRVTCSDPAPLNLQILRYACRRAISFLPEITKQGRFQDRGPRNEYYLPKVVHWGDCGLQVRLARTHSMITASWLEIRDTMEEIVDQCPVAASPLRTRGGHASITPSNGIIVSVTKFIPETIGVALEEGTAGQDISKLRVRN